MTTPYDTIKSAILGNPIDPKKKPSRTGVVKAFAEQQVQMEAAQAGALVFGTLADLNSVTSVPSADIMAWVTNDATLSNNGIYGNTGTAGAPAWTRRTDIPQFIITGINVGAGTVDAIQITTDLPMPSADGRAMLIVPVLGDNTVSPPTVSVNGGPALPIVSNSGVNIVVGGIKTGMFLSGFVADGKYRLLSDQASAAVVAAAEDAADRAETAAAAAALRDPVQFDMPGNGTVGPYDVGETIAADSAIVVFISGAAQIVGTDFTYSGSQITFTGITPLATDVVHGFVFASRGIPVPAKGTISVDHLTHALKQFIPSLSDDADVVDISRDWLIAVYHNALNPRHIKAFGNSKTDVGGGNATVDTAALNEALNSGEIFHITGATNLRVNNVLTVNEAGANITSMLATRVGGNAGSRIIVTDDAMPKLFDIKQPNFEASGFFIECGTGNTATTLFHFERAPGSASDIDAELKFIGHEGGAKFFHHYGRGLKLENIVSGNVKTCIGDMDWPASWTPNGQSNDTQETGMRAYEFYNIRMHGAASGIRNIGANSKNMRGLNAANWTGDIGVGNGGMFVGIPGIGSKFANFVQNIGATIAGGLLDLYAGSRDATFTNMSCVGIKSGLQTRLNRTAIIIRSTTADTSEDLKFIGGEIGPLNRYGVLFSGHGAMKNILFSGVSFDRTNIESLAYNPLFVFESGGSFTEVTLKLAAANFKFGGELAPSYILGGLNSSVVHLMKDTLSTKPSAIPWANTNVVVS